VKENGQEGQSVGWISSKNSQTHTHTSAEKLLRKTSILVFQQSA
jgi:hypothetical protein